MWSLAWWWVLLLLPLPALVRALWKPVPTEGQALRPAAASDYEGLARGSGLGAGRWPLILLWLIWSLACLAGARPQYVGEPVSLPLTGRDLLLAVDLSGSMEERDFQLAGRWVDRLTATKAVASRFIDRRVGDRVGLVLFGRNAYLQTPLTYDRNTVNLLLDESAIGLAGKETAIGDAIGLALKTLTAAGVSEGRRVLILLTDGANTAGQVDPLKAAQLAKDRGMTIYTIGIGAERARWRGRRPNPNRDLDERTLRAIADLTEGFYFRARDTAELENIYARLDELEPAAAESDGFRPVEEYFVWPLGAALGLGLAALLIVTIVNRRGAQRFGVVVRV